MNIAVFGGSFNPPHLGHQLVSKQILSFTKTDEVWIAPCFQHTFNKSLAVVRHRITMVKMLIEKKVQYCGEEIENKLSGETIELMNLLNRKYPQHQFSFIIGSDNLISFKKWGQWEKLLKTTEFLVFPRPKFEFDLQQYGLGNPNYQLKLISHPLLVKTDLSSTNIRKRIEKGLSIDYLVPEKVKKYIIKNNLYEKST